MQLWADIIYLTTEHAVCNITLTIPFQEKLAAKFSKMEDITTKGEKSGAMKDSEIPTVIDFPSSFSVGFERSLPSLEHLFKVDPHNWLSLF